MTELEDRRRLRLLPAPRDAEFVKAVGKDQNWKTYDDFRQMIEKEKLDGVMVETTTHARAWIAIQAMQAGHGRLHREADVPDDRRGPRDGQRRAEVQPRHPGRHAAALDADQQLGQRPGEERRARQDPDRARPELRRPGHAGPTSPAEPMPKGGSDNWWDIWTNQAELRPYHPRLHHGWDRWWDYDGGGRCFGVTGWGTHSYDQINRALGTDDTGPVEILLEEPVKVTRHRQVRPRSCGRRTGRRRRTPAPTTHGMAKLDAARGRRSR